jgi:hypothetical protein
VAIPEAQQAALAAVAKEFRDVQKLYLDRAKEPEVVAKTSAKDAVLIAAIADDKAFRAEGGPAHTVQHDVRIALVEPDGLRRLAAQVAAGQPAGGLPPVAVLEGDYKTIESADSAA